MNSTNKYDKIYDKEKEKLYRMIKGEQFSLLQKDLNKRKIKEVQMLLVTLAFEFKDELIYKFVKYLISSETNKDLLSEYHSLASVILTVAIPYLPYSFKNGVFHIREAIKIKPEDISLKIYFLGVYKDPNSKDYITKKEIKEIAREILEKEPNNQVAKEVLEK